MQRTDSQVKKFIKMAERKYLGEKLYTSLKNYWIRWNLNNYQIEMLTKVVRRAYE